MPDANLTILGWGPDAYVAECRALCKHLGIGQAVEFLGHVSDPFPYYAKAWLNGCPLPNTGALGMAAIGS